MRLSKNLESFSFADNREGEPTRLTPAHGKDFFTLMSSYNSSPEHEKAIIAQVLRDQREVFYAQYDIDKYNELDSDGQRVFEWELKYWIKKFKIAEELKVAQTSVRNVLIRFTDTEVFQHQMQLETIRVLLPFLRAQMQLIELQNERDGIPEVRTQAIPPLGSTTFGEIRLEIAEAVGPRFLEISEENLLKIMNDSVQVVAGHYKKAGGTAYIMDNETFSSLQNQQKKENEQKYRRLLEMREETLKAIEDAPPTLPHKEQVRLSRKSVDIGLRMVEFQKWFQENGLPVPGKMAQSSAIDGIKDWAGTKSEFCIFVQTEYENHKNQYKSLRNATFRLFEQYRFEDKKWTAFDCYELVKKV